MKKTASQVAEQVLYKVGFDSSSIIKNYSSNHIYPNTPHSKPSSTTLPPEPKERFETDPAISSYTNPETPLQPK